MAMYPSIPPEEAASRGYRILEAVAASPMLGLFDSTAEAAACMKGWDIVGVWDEQLILPSGPLFIRKFWCDPVAFPPPATADASGGRRGKYRQARPRD